MKKYRCLLSTSLIIGVVLLLKKMNMKFGPRPKLRPNGMVIVVDEHYKVLVYWIDEFFRGVFPANSTLILIDAHMNSMPPSIAPNFPLFRYPSSIKEVNSMVQGNYRFIKTAQMTHLLSRLVWIHPFWHDEKASFFNGLEFLGITFLRGKRHSCWCMKEPKRKKMCFVLNPHPKSGKSLVSLPYRECAVKKMTRFVEINAARAFESKSMLMELIGRAPLVLDIDEDFFAVRLVDSQLSASGISMTKREELFSALRRLFCTKDAAHEHVVDRWFFHFLEAMRNCNKTMPVEMWCFDNNAAVSKFFQPYVSNKKFFQKFYDHLNATELLCADLESKEAFLSLYSLVRTLKSDQIVALRRAGICLGDYGHSQATSRLNLCLGMRSPNRSIIKEYYPSRKELDRHFKKLFSILQSLPSQPRLITISRSVRTGHVPRDLQAEIEHRLLRLLRNVFHSNEKNIVFDRNLLNGKQGNWFNRQYKNWRIWTDTALRKPVISQNSPRF